MARKAASAPEASSATSIPSVPGRSSHLAGEALAVGRVVGEHGEPTDAELDGQLGSRRGGQPVGRTEAEDDAVVTGQLVGGGTWQNERKSGCRGQRGGSERTATVLRSDHADATRLGEDRRHRSGGTGGIAPIVTGDDPDGLGRMRSTTRSTAASSGPATIASSVENGATTPMHSPATPISVALLPY